MSNCEVRFRQTHAIIAGNVVIDLQDLHNDPQVIHNELIVEHEVGGMGAIRETRPAPLMSETPLRIGGATPKRGADTRAVLRGLLEYTEEELLAAGAEGAFGKFTP